MESWKSVLVEIYLGGLQTGFEDTKSFFNLRQGLGLLVLPFINVIKR